MTDLSQQILAKLDDCTEGDNIISERTLDRWLRTAVKIEDENARLRPVLASMALRVEKAEAERDAALKLLDETSRKLGEAEGKLAASEMAGVVEGWRERAEKADEACRAGLRALSASEAHVVELVEALRPFAEAAAYWDTDEWPDSKRLEGFLVGDLRRAAKLVGDA